MKAVRAEKRANRAGKNAENSSKITRKYGKKSGGEVWQIKKEKVRQHSKYFLH